MEIGKIKFKEEKKPQRKRVDKKINKRIFDKGVQHLLKNNCSFGKISKTRIWHISIRVCVCGKIAPFTINRFKKKKKLNNKKNLPQPHINILIFHAISIKVQRNIKKK